MGKLSNLFEANRKWAETINQETPGFFEEMAEGQSPDYMWIGCSDSRVVANQSLGLKPGDLFVHRNIANQVIPSDINCLSAIHYAVCALKVKHIIVCGHHHCGGIQACMKDEDRDDSVVDYWLSHLKDSRSQHEAELASAPPEEISDRFSEINVREQVINVTKTPAFQKAMREGWDITVHGWIFELKTGLLRDLNVSVSAANP